MHGISLAVNAIFEVQEWYGNENVCELLELCYVWVRLATQKAAALTAHN